MDMFDWTAIADEVIIRPVLGIAVYAASNGDIVIRQQSAHPDEMDQVVTISAAQVTPIMVKALAIAEYSKQQALEGI